MVWSWGPPTQFSPVRKSFRGRKTRCRRLNRPAKTINAIVCWFGTSCALSQIPAWDKTKLRTKVRTDRFSETHLSNLGHAGQIPVNLGQTNFNETQMSDIYWHADSPLDLGQNPVLTLLVKRPAGNQCWETSCLLQSRPVVPMASDLCRHGVLSVVSCSGLLCSSKPVLRDLLSAAVPSCCAYGFWSVPLWCF